MKALVIDALLESEGIPITMNELLTGFPRNPQAHAARKAVASTLMRFAKFIPDQVKGRAVPVIAYDPHAGLLSFAKTFTIVKELA
jgi:hypothetical protein